VVEAALEIGVKTLSQVNNPLWKLTHINPIIGSKKNQQSGCIIQKPF
jgi:hypothetical protein